MAEILPCSRPVISSCGWSRAVYNLAGLLPVGMLAESLLGRRNCAVPAGTSVAAPQTYCAFLEPHRGGELHLRLGRRGVRHVPHDRPIQPSSDAGYWCLFVLRDSKSSRETFMALQAWLAQSSLWHVCLCVTKHPSGIQDG